MSVDAHVGGGDGLVIPGLVPPEISSGQQVWRLALAEELRSAWAEAWDLAEILSVLLISGWGSQADHELRECLDDTKSRVRLLARVLDQMGEGPGNLSRANAGLFWKVEAIKADFPVPERESVLLQLVRSHARDRWLKWPGIVDLADKSRLPGIAERLSSVALGRTGDG